VRSRLVSLAMGFLDTFRRPRPTEPPSDAGPPAGELLSDAAPSTSGSEALGSSEPPPLSGLAFPSADGNQRLYNPYEGIGAAVDGRKGGAFRLPAQPEFLFSEEAAVHHRSWSENLTYYTGTGYLSGARAAPARLRPPATPGLLPGPRGGRGLAWDAPESLSTLLRGCTRRQRSPAFCAELPWQSRLSTASSGICRAQSARRGAHPDAVPPQARCWAAARARSPRSGCRWSWARAPTRAACGSTGC